MSETMKCDGCGKLTTRSEAQDRIFLTEGRTCPVCHGTGKKPDQPEQPEGERDGE